MTEREELSKKINDSFDIMKQIDVCEDEIILNMKKRKKAKGIGRFILLFIICACIAAIPFSIFSAIPFINDTLLAIPAFAVCFLFPIITPLILGNKSAAKYDKKIAELQAKLTEYQNSPLLSWLPMTYRDTVSYSYISSYIEDMRANTLQEAINLFETEKHRARLEENAKHTTKISFFI